jgi:hypothetical protein
VTCQHCGVALPPFALFCGECGRSVSAVAVVPPVLQRPTPPTALLKRESIPAAVDASCERCEQCGTPRGADDRFCGECGAPVTHDTRVVEPLPPPEPPVVLPLPDPPLSLDVESTRMVTPGTGGARFVLQFSTGESYTVLGSGLAGRNPRPEPGEYFDHLIAITEPGRSVSKTHLEFGQEAGHFWVSDRHSGNGTVIREPGSEPRLCAPGRRYSLTRGTRIDIGEQFIVVS